MPNRPNRGFTRREILKALLLVSPAMTLAACTARPANAPAPTTAAETKPPTQPRPTSAPPTIAPPAPTQIEAPTLAPTETPTALTQPTPAAEVVAQTLPPTPACGDDDDDPTPAQTEGPFYTPATPERNSFLEPGMTGTRMTVSGFVLDTTCRPVAGAMLDFWHCDDAGVYDNAGYKLRGHFFADEAGRYTLETIMPGIYTGRTRHFHVKVQAPNQPVLTTQLYFPDEPANTRDRIFRQECLMDVRDNTDGSKAGLFNFVLDVA